MIGAIAKTIGQLADPRVQKVMTKGLIGAVAVYLATLVGLWLILKMTVLFSFPWLETLVDWLTGASVLVVALLLFPAVVSIIVGVFLEDICSAVEAKHYPNLPAPRPQPISEVVMQTVKFAAVMVLLNILAMPFYLIFFWLGPLNLLVFYLLNGYLLSREYFELVAGRRLDLSATQALRRTHLGYLWVAGALIAFLLTIPVVNMFAPILGAAFMLHLFQELRRHQGGGSSSGAEIVTGPTGSGPVTGGGNGSADITRR